MLHATFDASREAVPGARLFVCGDIHGCLGPLNERLDAIGFDKDRDHLFALGDLLDRGPDSQGVVRLLNEPWFHSIKGNHEDMLQQAFEKVEARYRIHHINNGGSWFSCLGDDDQAEIHGLVADLPIAMTVTTNTGRSIGLVHADVFGADWDEFLSDLEDEDMQSFAMWKRARIYLALERRPLAPIKGVDHVFFGHTPVDAPLHSENMSWIDTQCYRTGEITVIEI